MKVSHYKKKSKLQFEKMMQICKKNNDKRFFSVNGVKFEITGSFISKEKEVWMHHVKNVSTGKYKRFKELDGSLGDIVPISDKDLCNLLKTHKQENK